MAGTGKFEDMHLDDLSLEPLPDPNQEDWCALSARHLSEG